MKITKIVHEDFVRMPWKDGGGETLQIAISPADATLDDFDWRISSARVSSAGPFSRFDGVDRSLAILGGGYLQLALTRHNHQPTPLTLWPDSEPLAFPGEASVISKLEPGSTVFDFNVMTRRQRCSHRLEALTLVGDTSLSAPTLLIYCVAGTLSCRCTDTNERQLEAGAALLAQGDDGRDVCLQLQASEGARLYVAHIQTHPLPSA